MIHQPDDVESVGHNARIGEVFLHHRAIGGGQIHAYHQDIFLALQTLQIRIQRGFGATQNHIIDGVILQIAERGGKALAASEEMFVDPQNAWAAWRTQGGELSLQHTPEVALHGGRSQRFSPAQPAAVNAVEMIAAHHFLKGFTRPLPPEYTRKPLPKIVSTVAAVKLTSLQFQDAAPCPYVLMPDSPAVRTLVAQGSALALGASHRLRMMGRYSQLSTRPFRSSNLVAG